MADAGKIVITPKGAYSSTKTYEWLDEVSYNGNAYVALKTVTGVTPSDDGVNWRLFMSSTDVDANVLVPKFTEASTRSNIVSGENLSTMFGKIKKWFTDLKSHAFKDLVNNLTTETTGSALDASQGKILKDEVDGVNRNLTQLEVSDIAGGKNLLKNTVKSNTINGVTFTVNDDKSVSCIGTATKDISVTINQITLPNGTYIYNGSSAYIKKNDGTWYKTIYDGDEFTITETYNMIQAIIWVKSGEIIDKTIYPMIRKANITDDTYEPYIPSVKMLAEGVVSQNASLEGLGKCKNTLNPTLETTTSNGVTCTNNGDGTYTLNGTSSAQTTFVLKTINDLPIGKYILLSDSIYISAYLQKSDGTWVKTLLGGDIFEITSTNSKIQVVIFVESGKTMSNEIVKPMVTTNLNATADDFVPYTGDGDTLTADVATLKNDLSTHTHNYAGSDTPGGSATYALQANKDGAGNVIDATYINKTYMRNYGAGSIAFGNNMFIGIFNGDIICSSDGQEWEANFEQNLFSLLDNDEILLGITYGNEKFVSFSNKGCSYVSSDNGNTWTKTQTIITV